MGRSAGKKNVGAFDAFVSERERRGDWDEYVTPDRSRLRRGKIVKACGFSRSVLLQNNVVAGRLLRLEKALRKRAILKSLAEEPSEDLLDPGIDRDERIRGLEDRAEELESSIHELRRSIDGIEQLVDEIQSG